MARKTTRRDFIRRSTALGLGFWVSGSPAWTETGSPNERLQFACIGVGGKGVSDTEAAGRHGDVAAICDIDNRRLDRMSKRFPLAKKYSDYRKMLEELAKKIDAVTVSTPDHTHAQASLLAMRLGMHCFCQKPLTWSLAEARLMRETAEKMRVASQMGNQGTARDQLREAVEVVRAGWIGDVREVHTWTNRPTWPQGIGRPKETPPVPRHVHWNLFLGAAPERPYHPAYHPFRWRGWLDFGTGALGDMGCHVINMPFMALDLFGPATVEAESSGIVDNETYPRQSVVRYEFPARGKLGPVKLNWYDGGRMPPRELFHGEKIAGNGALLIGAKGSLYYPRGDYILLPRKAFADRGKPEKALPRSPGHFREFAIACRGGPPAMSNFDYAGRLTETVLLGNLALRVGKKIRWESQDLKVANTPEADQIINRPYRAGWEL